MVERTPGSSCVFSSELTGKSWYHICAVQMGKVSVGFNAVVTDVSYSTIINVSTSIVGITEYYIAIL